MVVYVAANGGACPYIVSLLRNCGRREARWKNVSAHKEI